jgi:hypothetical protein
MTVYVGDIIKVTNEDESGWWTGILERTGEEGIFPSNFSDPYDPESEKNDEGEGGGEEGEEEESNTSENISQYFFNFSPKKKKKYYFFLILSYLISKNFFFPRIHLYSKSDW